MIVNKLLETFPPTYNIRELIPGWDDGIQEPEFYDNWETELNLDDDWEPDITLIGDGEPLECGEYIFDPQNMSQEEYQELKERFPDEDYPTYTEEDKAYLALIDGCIGCAFFSHNQSGADFICTLHPEGNLNCPDFEDK